MSESIMGEKYKSLIVFFIFLLFAGVLCGSIYTVKFEGGTGMSEYFNTYFNNTLPELNKKTVFINSVKSNILMLTTIFLSGFFRLGFLVSGACVAKKGFTAGFTAASFVKLYGSKGILVYFSTVPPALVTFTAILLYSSISMSLALNRNNLQKNEIFLYIFITFFFGTIFCITSFFDGYLTTTFMEMLAGML